MQGYTPVLPEQHTAALMERPSSALFTTHMIGEAFGPMAHNSPFTALLLTDPRAGPSTAFEDRSVTVYSKTDTVISVKEMCLMLQGQT